MPAPQIELKELRLLTALLAERSVSAAAKRMGLTQPAASNALARLRKVFGDPLFVRSGQGVAPTPRALALEPVLRRSLADLDGLVAPPRRFDPATSTQVFTIAATDFGEFVLLPPLLRLLAREAPGVSVRAVPLEASFPLAELESGALDLAIGAFRTAPPRLLRQSLFTESSVTLLRRGHPAARQALTLERFAQLGHVLVAPRGESAGLIDEVLRQRGLARRIVATVPHFLAAAFMVQETDLVVTLAARVARRFLAMLELAVATPPVELPSVTIAQLCHERNRRDPAHRWLRAKLAAVAKTV